MRVAVLVSLVAVSLSLNAATAPDDLRAEARELFEMGNFEQAMVRFEEAEKADPSHDGIEFLKEIASYDVQYAPAPLRDDPEKLRALDLRIAEALGRSARRFPQRDDVYHATAILVRAKAFEAAQSLAAEVVNAAPKNFEAVKAEMLATAERAKNEPARAKTEAERLIALSDRFVPGAADERHAYFAGVLDYEVAVGTSAPAELRRALLDRADAALKRAVALKPTFMEAQLYRSVAKREKAKLASTPEEAAKLTAEADRLRTEAMEMRNHASSNR